MKRRSVLSAIICISIGHQANAGGLSQEKGLIPTLPPPPKSSYGADVDEVKIFTIPTWSFVKEDGETAITFNNMQVTLLHLKRGDKFSTAVRANFDQYNNTQNNRGSHNANIKFDLIGSSNSTLSTPLSTEIVRDSCRDQGTVNVNQVELGEDVFRFVTQVKASVRLYWNHEGKC